MVPTHCLICLKNVPERNLKANKDEFSDLFQVLCKHMKWTPREKYNFDFQKENFPFCKACRATLVTLDEYNELLESVQERINRTTFNLVAEILQTKNKNLDRFSGEEISDEDSSQVVSVSHKVGFYRNVVFRRYCPSVKLVDASTDSLRYKLNAEDDSSQSQDVSVRAPDTTEYQLGALDLDHLQTNDFDMDAGECFVIELINSNLGEQAGSVEEVEKEIGTGTEQAEKEEEMKDEDFEDSTASPDLQGDNFECKDEDEEDVKCKEKSGEERKHRKYTPSASAKKSKLEDQDSQGTNFRKSKYEDRIRSLGDNKFLFDNKDTFEYHPGGEWTCYTCGVVMFKKANMICHLGKGHKRKSTKRIETSLTEVEPNKFLFGGNFSFEFVEDKFKCGTCSTSFDTRSKILSHIRMEHLSVKIQPHMLFFTSPSPGKFVAEGFSFEQRGSDYHCDHCVHSCSKLATMKDHIKRHLNDKRFPCETCGKRFNDKFDLRKHKVRHKADRPFICEQCGKSFKLRNSLTNHISYAHPNLAAKSYCCDTCGQAYGTRALLRIHVKSHEVVVCHVCGKEVSGSKLYYHLARHAEENECKVCGKKFTVAANLIPHELAHAGKKPFSCDICNFTFTRAAGLKKHKSVVHNPNKTTKSYNFKKNTVYRSWKELPVPSQTNELEVNVEELPVATEEIVMSGRE